MPMITDPPAPGQAPRATRAPRPQPAPSPDTTGARARIVLHVDHLGFEGTCVGLARQLAAWPDIRPIRVDVRAGLAVVEYDATRLSVADLEYAVAACGYACRRTGNGACRAHPGLRCNCMSRLPNGGVGP